MALDPNKLNRNELVQLLNSTALGESITRSRLDRQMNRAGRRWHDGRHIRLVEYLRWLAREIDRPVKPKIDGRAADLARKNTETWRSQNVAPVPDIADPARRADSKTLVNLMQTATGEKPKLWGPSIIGFGSYHYKYDSGREGDMPVVGFSPRKAATVLYGATRSSDSEALLAKLGKHTTGKGCLYIKKLTDVDEKVLETLVLTSVAAKRARHPS